MGKKETFEALQQAVSESDLEAMRTFLADDFVLHEPPSLPFGGDFFGAEGYIELGRQIQSFFELEVVSLQQTEARADMLLLELVVRFKSRRTGEQLEMDLVDLYHFDLEGKISRVNGYYSDPDRIAAIALGRPCPPRASRNE